MKPNREYREWYLKDNFYERNVIHPVGDIFGTQIDVHAIEMRAYLEALAQAEKLAAALFAIKKHTLHPDNKPSVWSDYLQDLADEALENFLKWKETK